MTRNRPPAGALFLIPPPLNLIPPVAPVPRLVLVAAAIAARKRHHVMKCGGMLREPAKGGGVLELGLERRAPGSCDCNCVSRMMLAVAGLRSDPQYRFDGEALLQLAPDDVHLPIDAAKCGCDCHRHAVRPRGLPQSPPGLRGGRGQQ